MGHFALLDPDPQFESGSGSSNSNYCGSGSANLAGLRIRIDLMLDPDTDRDPAFFLIADPDPGFDDLKLEKNITGNLISIFLIKNCNLQIPWPS